MSGFASGIVIEPENVEVDPVEKFGRYIVIDTETTGLPKRGDFRNVHLAEYGIIRSWDGDAHSLVQLPEGVDLHPAAAKVNGLSREKCAEGLPLEVALQSLIRAVMDGAPIIGHNVIAFDIALIHSLMRRTSKPDTTLSRIYIPRVLANRPVIDTKLIQHAETLGMRRECWEPLSMFYGRVMSAGKMLSGDRRASLESECRRLEILAGGEKQRHRAIDDCRLTERIFLEQIRSGMVERVLGDLFIG